MGVSTVNRCSICKLQQLAAGSRRETLLLTTAVYY